MNTVNNSRSSSSLSDCSGLKVSY